MTQKHRGILLMIVTVFLFAIQDGFSRYLAQEYNTLMVIMIRYWGFAIFVLMLAWRKPEGIKAAIATRHLGLHVFRGAALVIEVAIIVLSYTIIGLIETHAIFAICPLLIVALSGPVLKEKVTLPRLFAVGVGLTGVLIILRPGDGVVSWASFLPFTSALLFALYSLLTRKVSQLDRSFPIFFWPAITGLILSTVIGVPNLEPLAPQDILPMAAYVGIAIASNWMMQKAYATTEASTLQPFTYLQIAFVSMIAVIWFDEVLALPVVIGTCLIILAGIYAFRSERP